MRSKNSQREQLLRRKIPYGSKQGIFGGYQRSDPPDHGLLWIVARWGLQSEKETYIRVSMTPTSSTSPSDTYRRGQVEWALWRMSTIGRPAPEEATLVFRNRIKRLLEIDRTGAFEASRKGKGQLAFSEDRPEGTGFDVAFTAYNAFILALGLDLLRMGFIQSEVVMLMNFLRPRLGKIFDRILQNPPDPERRSARVKRHAVKPEQDRRVFLLLERVEASEEFPALHQRAVAGTIRSIGSRRSVRDSGTWRMNSIAWIRSFAAHWFWTWPTPPSASRSSWPKRPRSDEVVPAVQNQRPRNPSVPN